MNGYQELWWEQAKSDHKVYLLLRRCRSDRDIAPCHQLHYLQMTTEKLAKAYFWRSKESPPKSHAGFVKFLRALGGVKTSQRGQIVKVFGYKRFENFQFWLPKASKLAYALERLAPALAQDNGPNPEYPWPHSAPKYAPSTFEFPIWKELTETGVGRQFLQFIEDAVQKFPVYGSK